MLAPEFISIFLSDIETRNRIVFENAVHSKEASECVPIVWI